jgi:hypothetical protein
MKDQATIVPTIIKSMITGIYTFSLRKDRQSCKLFLHYFEVGVKKADTFEPSQLLL